jgi:anti-sigma B factor antagonist
MKGRTEAQAGERLAGGHPKVCPVCGTRSEEAAPGAAEAPCPRCGHLLWYISCRVGDVTVVHLVDSRAAVLELLELLDNAVEDGSFGKILLDFGGIQQVSSAALGKLVKLMGRAHAVRGKLALCDLHPDLRHVLHLTRLDTVFEIHDTEAEALAALGASAG